MCMHSKARGIKKIVIPDGADVFGSLGCTYGCSGEVNLLQNLRNFSVIRAQQVHL